jgi:hypothetical protein
MKTKTKIKRQFKKYIRENIGGLIIIGMIVLVGVAANINLYFIETPIIKNPIIINRDIATATPLLCQKLSYDIKLDKLGNMGNEIRLAAEEFSTSTEGAIKLKGLLIGIANAESGLGKNFAVAYDKDNCHNWWGVKGGNTSNRKDGSSLRCFESDKAGARTVAKLLSEHYIGQGLTEPESMVYVYVGKKWSQYHQTWVNNVRKYYENI